MWSAKSERRRSSSDSSDVIFSISSRIMFPYANGWGLGHVLGWCFLDDFSPPTMSWLVQLKFWSRKLPPWFQLNGWAHDVSHQTNGSYQRGEVAALSERRLRDAHASLAACVYDLSVISRNKCATGSLKALSKSPARLRKYFADASALCSAESTNDQRRRKRN